MIIISLITCEQMWTGGSGSKSTKLYTPKEGGAVLHLGPWIIPVSRAKGPNINLKKKKYVIIW